MLDKTYILEEIPLRFSILLRTSIIRSTCAHVTVAKVVGAATWPPHGPPWGAPRSRGQAEISRLGLKDFDQGDERCLAGVPPTYTLGGLGKRRNDGSTPHATGRDLPRINLAPPGTPHGYVGHLCFLHLSFSVVEDWPWRHECDNDSAAVGSSARQVRTMCYDEMKCNKCSVSCML